MFLRRKEDIENYYEFLYFIVVLRFGLMTLFVMGKLARQLG
jgi:hypothetical protein